MICEECASNLNDIGGSRAAEASYYMGWHVVNCERLRPAGYLGQTMTRGSALSTNPGESRSRLPPAEVTRDKISHQFLELEDIAVRCVDANFAR